MRLKTTRRQIDWPALIWQLQKDTGARKKDIAKASGYNEDAIIKLSTEQKPVDEMNRVIDLMMLFLANTDRDLPILGEHNE